MITVYHGSNETIENPFVGGGQIYAFQKIRTSECLC